MATYKVYYETPHGFYRNDLVDADSETEAIKNLRMMTADVEHIVHVIKL